MPLLETRRLALRPYVESDRESFVELVSDPDLMARIGGAAQAPESLFERLLRHDPEDGELAWAITLRAVRGLRAIEATVDADHWASRRVLENAGFQRSREERDDAGVYLVYRFGK